MIGSELYKLIDLNDLKLLSVCAMSFPLLMHSFSSVRRHTAATSLAAKLSTHANPRLFSSNPHIVPSQSNLLNFTTAMFASEAATSV